MAEGYDPARSSVGNDKLSEFMQAPITGDLLEVPGIGPSAKEKLIENGVTTTFALFGKFLMLKDEGVQSVEHCDRFWYWIKDTGINSHRAGIVRAVAEKLDTMFPGIYDGGLYENS
mmetsp:Transcript_17940/g.18009  ORF Transcript_17940/g.18009 Transcript_17940/m.18009 type:complete len:116 (+) Transcript_17940:126-473(+)|eukprot:CAMPEP_0182418816 /NCGR_PEP_ID=MMETSP1167-20130531/3191_1 /TAXON_ID=2988 /ORGANISM="Mallomonas Sp, Strain CCMP3275" /LENGTH=115 /DNA_ID=CAMNT_0024593229 /DNA_START=74 /DNA_END=421 /DNA_ORIENTATION=+